MSTASQPPDTGIAKLLDALEDLSCGYALVASTGALLDVNDALAAMVGYSRDEMLGLSAVTELISPEDREQVAGDIALRLRGLGGPLPRRLELLARDGRRIPVAVATAATTTEADTQVTCLFRRTTGDAEWSQSLDEERLQTTRARLGELMTAGPVIVAEGRADKIVYGYISPNVERILGYRPEEIVGNLKWIPEHMHPEDFRAAVAHLEEALEQQADECEVTVRYRHRDGS
ncbi:MAG TPA: PAS domain S-box protein, partial [Acidimicrobiia bacterium]|nr:PAS domain S-box protein [Acidimicrobiia bacterium]